MKRSNYILLRPNFLSYLRIALTPLLCGLLLTLNHCARLGAAILFLAACFTDYADGYIARRTKQKSELGAILDPFADKVLTFTTSCTLMYLQSCTFGQFVCLCGLLIRDVGMMTLRSAFGHKKLPVSRLSQWKTGLQMTGLFLMISPLSWHPKTSLTTLALWGALLCGSLTTTRSLRIL